MAKFGNLPEVVIYSEFGKEHKALVIGSRDLEHHTGEDGEPLLNLVIVKPVVIDECLRCHFPERAHGKPVAPGARSMPCADFVAPEPAPVTDLNSLVNIVTDVAHGSHVFTDANIEALGKSGVTFRSVYPGGQIVGGRWREIAEPVAAVPPAKEPESAEPPQEPSGNTAPPVVQ